MTDKFRCLRALTILSLALLSTWAALAQTKPVSKKDAPVIPAQKQPGGRPPAAAKAEPTKPLTRKFNLGMVEGNSIDKSFSEVSSIDLVNALEKITSLTKGDFESTDDFNVRKARALSGQLLGDYGVDDLFAIVRGVTPAGRYPRGFNYSFNPDTSEVSLFVLPTSGILNRIGAPDYEFNRREVRGLDIFDFDTRLESQSTYQGRNPYGAIATIQKSVWLGTGMAVEKVTFLDLFRQVQYLNPPPSVQFRLENSRAAKELPALNALIVFKLTEPLLHYHFARKEPTLDSPTDFSAQYKYISGSILGIVFYSGLTGEIFARLPKSFGNATVVPPMYGEPAVKSVKTNTD